MLYQIYTIDGKIYLTEDWKLKGGTVRFRDVEDERPFAVFLNDIQTIREIKEKENEYTRMG